MKQASEKNAHPGPACVTCGLRAPRGPRALAVAARRVGQDEVERVCQAILEQEQAMADWLFERQPQLIEAFLEREQADLQAKR